MAEKLKNLSQMNLRLRRGAVVIGDVLYAPGGEVGPRIQHDYQLVVIHRGSLDLRLDDERISVPENHAILLSPRHREHFLFARKHETRHSWCAVDPGVVPVFMRRHLRGARGPIPFLGPMATLLDLGRARATHRSEDESLQNGFYLGLGLALLSDFAAAVGNRETLANPPELALLRMEQFIHREYARTLSLADIARAVGVSRQHLLKLCRLRGRPSPMTQLYLKRLELSTDLLAHTGLSIGEIATRCGFVSAFHFSRKFKETYGKGPFAWRKSLWKVHV